MSVGPALEAHHGRTHGKLPRAVFEQQRRKMLERLGTAGVEPEAPSGLTPDCPGRGTGLCTSASGS
ncbi:hypothetical protein CG736_11485 [Kitasatospora sp. CB02891]|nr:hypothetical protein CG736_11485 [Kitasatospora sp. CB02891]